MSETLRIAIRLTPRAARNAVQGWAAGADGTPLLKAAVTAVPEKGKANEALVALLSKQWHIPKSRLRIVRGETDRNKIVEIDRASAEEKRLILDGAGEA